MNSKGSAFICFVVGLALVAAQAPGPGNVTTTAAPGSPPSQAPVPGDTTTGASTTVAPGANTTVAPGGPTSQAPAPGDTTTGATTTVVPGANTTVAPGGPTSQAPVPGDTTTGASTTVAPGATNTAAPPGGTTGDSKPIWEFEYTTLPAQKICHAKDKPSIENCKNLKEKIAANFHTDRKLNLEDGRCAYLHVGGNGTANSTTTTPSPTTQAGGPAGTDTTTTHSPTTVAGAKSGHHGPLRCIYTGNYTEKNGKVERFRLHFFNNKHDPKAQGDKICAVEYWGDAKQTPVEEVPLPVPDH